MKIKIFAFVVPTIGLQFAGVANAATGAPSTQETGRIAHSQSAPADVNRSDAGSYARYLMLNGKSRQEAIELARNVDPQASSSMASQSAPIDSEYSDVGSYARYLMLNGESREDAIRHARNIDHSAASIYAIHGTPNAPGSETSQH